VAVGPALSTDDLSGRVALVCGGAGRIGSAITRQLAARGASVAVHCHHRLDRAESLLTGLKEDQPTRSRPQRHIVVAGDLANITTARTVVQQVHDRLCAWPTIVVNAAHPDTGSATTEEISDSHLNAHIDGFRIHVNVCRTTIVGMRSSGIGRLVLISGALAVRPFPGLGVYGAVKAAATAFSRTLALEEGPYGTTVNIVSLGRVEYEDGTQAFDPDPRYEALDEITRMRRALTKMAAPTDVARTVSFLVSPASTAITGQVLYLAGGEAM
jgi:3-oxoacyl-[acyl-carrier protein] reductase